MGNGGLANITLRDAVAADRDAIIAISTITQHEHEARLPDNFLPGGDASVPDMYALFFDDPPRGPDLPFARLIVACIHDRVIGHASLLFSVNKTGSAFHDLRCHIDDVSVHPEFRGRGVGTALLQQAQTICRDEQATIIEGYVWQGNAPSARLFEVAGFNPAATLFTKRLLPPMARAPVPPAPVPQGVTVLLSDQLLILGAVITGLLVLASWLS